MDNDPAQSRQQRRHRERQARRPEQTAKLNEIVRRLRFAGCKI